MGRAPVIRLVTQFDPPTRHASVATATCSSCSCCCCCCCLVSGAAVAGFTVMNLRAVARGRERPRSVGRLIGAAIVTVIAVPIMGLGVLAAAVGIGTPGSSSVIPGALVAVLLPLALMTAFLAMFYQSAGARRVWVAGASTAVIGGLIGAGEGGAVLASVASLLSTNGGLVAYLILIPIGALLGVGAGVLVDEVRRSS